MRTIKFRGKRVDNGEWVFGSLLSLHKDCCEIFHIEDIDKHKGIKTNVLRVIPETVGQFTGLVDKNGKEIYEGDIVKCWEAIGLKGDLRREYYCPMVVSYCKLWTAFVVEDKPNKKQYQLWRDFCIFEVIGNIHDNENLLTELK